MATSSSSALGISNLNLVSDNCFGCALTSPGFNSSPFLYHLTIFGALFVSTSRTAVCPFGTCWSVRGCKKPNGGRGGGRTVSGAEESASPAEFDKTT